MQYDFAKHCNQILLMVVFFLKSLSNRSSSLSVAEKIENISFMYLKHVVWIY